MVDSLSRGTFSSDGKKVDVSGNYSLRHFRGSVLQMGATPTEPICTCAAGLAAWWAWWFLAEWPLHPATIRVSSVTRLPTWLPSGLWRTQGVWPSKYRAPCCFSHVSLWCVTVLCAPELPVVSKWHPVNVYRHVDVQYYAWSRSGRRRSSFLPLFLPTGASKTQN